MAKKGDSKLPAALRGGKRRYCRPLVPGPFPALKQPETRVQTLMPEKSPMRAALDDFAVMKDENFVRADNRAEAVRHGDGRPALKQHRQCPLRRQQGACMGAHTSADGA